MFPIPPSLAGFLCPKDDSLAHLVCSCGGRKFSLHHTGKPKGDSYPAEIEFQNHRFFRVEAHCLTCKRKILLVDRYPTPDAPQPPLILWRCLKCGATEHDVVFENHSPQITIHIRCIVCGKEEKNWAIVL